MQKGSKHSEEAIQKMRERKKGEKHPFYGKKHTDETRRKIGEANKGKQAGKNHPMFGKSHSIETKTKMSIVASGAGNPFYGKCHTVETRRKLSEAQKGEKNHLHGKHLSEETKRKIREARQGKYVGENSANWHGGKSFEQYGVEFNKKLKEQIRKRDSNRCRECFRHQSELFSLAGKPYKLIVHHIDYNKKNNNSDNLISLCRNCHVQTNFKRKDWIQYFRERIQ